MLKEFKKSVDTVLTVLKENNVTLDTVDFCDSKRNEYSISYLTNGGDIRSIEFFFSVPKDSKKKIYYKVVISDRSIGAGIYTKQGNTKDKNGLFYLENQPFCWQTFSFDTQKSKKMYILQGKDTVVGERVEFVKEFDKILEPIYRIFWRSEKFIANYYYQKNLRNRMFLFKNGETSLEKEEDVVAIFPKKKNFEYFH